MPSNQPLFNYIIKHSYKIIKTSISKIPKRSFCEDHWNKTQEKFENVWLRVVGGILTPIRPHVKEKEKKNHQNFNFQNFKNPNVASKFKFYTANKWVSFCEHSLEENSGKVWKLSPAICRSSLAFLNFCSQRVPYVNEHEKSCIKINKRPRGLDALLGHLLVKIIPVTYQLSSTKIPKYLSQK